MSANDLARFMSKVEKTPDGCWRWTGGVKRNANGRTYAQFKTEREGVLAHRAVFRHYHGSVGGKALKRKCRMELCVNPEHWILS